MPITAVRDGDAFELLQELGRGGFATTYRARVLDPDLRDEFGTDIVALKIPLNRQKERVLRRELELNAGIHMRMRGLASPHLVRYLGFVSFHDQITMVMEYVDQGSLRRLLGSPDAPSPLPVHQAVGIADGLLDGLSVIHAEGILHRDIKPENVLLHDGVPKIADLGISRMLDADELAQTFAGTTPYTAPEILTSHGATFSADLWSLTVTLYEMLTGRLPFGDPRTPLRTMIERICESQHEPPSRVTPAIPPELDAIIARGLRKHRENRYTSADEMRQAIGAFQRKASGLAIVIESTEAETKLEIAPTPSDPAVFAEQTEVVLRPTPVPPAPVSPMPAPPARVSRGPLALALAGMAVMVLGIGVYLVRGAMSPGPVPDRPSTPVAAAAKPPQPVDAPAVERPRAAPPAATAPAVPPTKKEAAVKQASAPPPVASKPAEKATDKPTATDTPARASTVSMLESTLGAPPPRPSPPSTNARVDAGVSGPVDSPKAFSLYQRACDSGNLGACVSLGVSYLGGTGIAKSSAQALSLFLRACDQKNGRGCNMAAVAYSNAWGVVKDDQRAVEFLTRGCDAGHARSCYVLGNRYRNGVAPSTKDDARAAPYLERACELTLADACIGIAFAYQQGLGVDKNLARAAELSKRALDLRTGGTAAAADSREASGSVVAAETIDWMPSREYQFVWTTHMLSESPPTRVEGRLNEGREEFRATFANVPPWCDVASVHGMSKADYDQRQTQYQRQGFSLSASTQFDGVGGVTKYQAVWTRGCVP